MQAGSSGAKLGSTPGRAGFTLLEILLAVSIMAVVMTATYLSFSAGIIAWKRGMALAEELHHGDFVAEQLVMALRSAYYPDAPGTQSSYGFIHKDGGDDAGSADTIEWVKLGRALVGEHTGLAEIPHRVEFFIGEDEGGKPGVTVRAWRLYGQPEDFDPEEDVDPRFISAKITGFNCRMAYNVEEGEIEWLDTWEETNRLPRLVECTLFLPPLEEGGAPVEIRRVVEIPTAELSW